jgi:hypothetical protein
VSEDRRSAAARRVHEAQKCFRVFSNYDTGECWVHPATLKAMKEAERACADGDYDRAAHLAEVVLVMIRRDTAKYQADPNAWIAKMRAVEEAERPRPPRCTCSPRHWC